MAIAHVILPRFESMKYRGYAAVVLFFTVMLMGCGGAGYGEVGVSGQVTYNGEPLAGVHLSFQPVSKDKSGFGPGSFGRTDEEGRFELRTVWPDAPGAVAGEHRVTISYEDPSKKPRGVVIPREYVEGTATFQVPEEGTDKAMIEITTGK
jgi:hypothetical protein